MGSFWVKICQNMLQICYFVLKIVEGPPSVGRLVGGASVLSVSVRKLPLESADFWNPVPRERTVSKNRPSLLTLGVMA